MRLVFAAFALAVLATACSGGGSKPSATTSPPATDTPGGAAPATPVTPSPETTAAPGPAARYGPAITAADVTVSLPAVKDGRQVWPVGTWGGRIIIKASLPFRPNPSGSQDSANDDEFLAWDPVANTFQLLWTNQSMRQESVYAIEGDWALLETAGYNPFIKWELRLHNIATGEERFIDAEDPTTRGTTPVGLLDSRVVDGRVLWVNAVVIGGERVEQLKMFDIATGQTSIIESSAGPQVPGGTFDPGGISGNTVAYLRGAHGTARTVVLRGLSTGAERVVPPPSGTIWEAISPDVRFAVARQDLPPAVGSAPEGPRSVVNLASGEIRGFADGQSYGFGVDFADAYISWQVAAADNAVNGFFSLDSGLNRIIDPSVPVDGQGARVFDGWFFWRERAAGSTAANNDRANDVLRFMRLP